MNPTKLCDELEDQPQIETLDSWPTGMANRGPSEYGINTTGCPSKQEVLTSFQQILDQNSTPGFHVECDSAPDKLPYDLVAAIHQHPLADTLFNFFDEHEAATSFDIDWSPLDIEVCYTNRPNRTLIAPGTLDICFEATNSDYDTILDDLGEILAEWQSKTNYNVSLSVDSADPDHCHVGLTAAHRGEFRDYLEQTYQATPEPVWDKFGQNFGVVYSLLWLPADIYVMNGGTAYFGGETATPEYDPTTPEDVISFRQKVHEHALEHTPPSRDKRDRDELTSAVATSLTNHEAITSAYDWLSETPEPGDMAYGIHFDSEQLPQEELLDLVGNLVEEHDEDAESFPVTVRDSTDRYAARTHDAIVTAAFQLS